MNKKYWVKSWYSDYLLGPYTLKEAMEVQNRKKTPCIILKTVIDENGEEVK